MLNNCGMDCANYASTLVGWNATGPNGRTLGATGRSYGTVATAARANLVLATGSGGKGWTITGDAACPGKKYWSGTGTWNASNINWGTTSGGPYTVAAFNAGDTAIFEGTAGTVTASSPNNPNSMTFNVTGYTLSSGTITFNANPCTITTGSGVSATISSQLAGSSRGLTKEGAGTLILSGANTYTGVTNINSGILNIQNNTALGTTANGTVVGTSAKLQLQNNITVTGEALTLNGGGLVLGTGGTMTTFGDYTIHTFTSNGTFNPGINRAVEYLVIGGGGGGGGAWTGGNWTGGGGGGAGGYRSSVGGESSGGGASAESPIMLGVGAHPIVVGAGGSGGSLTNNGTNGFDSYIQDPSSVDVIRSVGGGGGAGAQWFVRRDGLAGGSGGGAAGGQGTGSIGGSGTASQGFNGGLHGANRGSGAGGGAGAIGLNSGAAGTDAYGNTYAKIHGGSGGSGLFSSITGTSIQRAGGGGGGCDETGNYLPGIGGLGGGGTGGTPTFTVGSSGTANTGGGGGGGTRSAGGAGGSGLVVLRYLSIGALENVSGNNFWTGTVTMLADNIITTTSGTLNISGVISGAFALTKNGTGTLILPTANTYSGGTTLKTGTLNINNASALGTAAGTFTIDGGTIDNTSGAAITTVNYPLALNADFTFTGTNDLNLGTGAVTMSANRQVTTSANTLTIGGVINDNTKSLTKLGNGQLSFAAQAVTLNALTISAGTLRSTSGNLSLSGGFTNNGTFTHNSGTAVFAGTSAQSISGSSTTTFNNVTISNSSVTGVTLNSPANVNTLLTLTSGLVNTTATNILTLLNGATTTIGSSVSYINGPMGYVKASIGSSTLNLPLGKSKDWRPEELTVNHGTATSYTYVAELFNGDANAFGYTLPSTINRVSSIHYVDIVRNITGGAASNADLTGATIRMYYSTTNGAGDSVLDYTNLKIAKAPIGGPAWEDIGGTATANGTGNILSNSFTTFSRFALSNNTGGANPLPIVLLSFTAKPNGDDVDLNWTTSVEINNDFFTVERSQDGENFSFVSTVKGAGNSMILKKYYTKDVQAYSGISYYRLKQTDYSGHYQYSNIIAVKFLSEILKSVVVYPNPVANELHIELPGNTETVNFEILSATGALVYKGSVNERITVPTTSFSSGVYVIKIENGSAFEFKKIIKD
jgi:autotransporter-associated beta strand protein